MARNQGRLEHQPPTSNEERVMEAAATTVGLTPIPMQYIIENFYPEGEHGRARRAATE